MKCCSFETGYIFDIKLSLIERSLKYWKFCVWLKPYWYAIHLKQVIYFYIKLYHKKKSHLLKGSIFADFGMWYTKSNVRILGFWILIRNKRKNLLSKQKKNISNTTRKTNVNRFKVAISVFLLHAGFNKTDSLRVSSFNIALKSLFLIYFFFQLT